ncbi:MAG: N-acetylglucosamine-specific PTS transporter subunit IIBC [Corynebacterium sp.]|nr:N-acetylglucosamine-specific PTS transporter subunit IIBC [Corynebacterium sp.]
MSTIMTSLQKLGKALMGAVAVMPVAAILLGVGYWIDPDGWGTNNIAAQVLITAGSAVLDNLGWIFAIAIAYGLSKDNSGAAALAGFIGFATVVTVIGPDAVASYKGIEDVSAMSETEAMDWTSHGWDVINGKNVLIGILIGCIAAWAYNSFHKVKLPDFLAFFGGRRLVPILTSFFAIGLSGILYFVWPVLYKVLFDFGRWIQELGAVGAGLYGFFNRLLIPTGLHHALNSIFWFDVAGINDIGKFLGGGATIDEAAAATDAASCPGVWEDGTCEVVGVIGQYQAGFFPIMMFGLPGAALAIYLRARSERKKAVGSLMLAGALTAFLTGVTEPLEFSFMFVAPLLYLVHALLTGLSLFIAALGQWTTGFAFSAGTIDMILQARNPLANQWWMLLIMGVIYFVVYFAIFYYLIGRFNLCTPGREAVDPAGEGPATTVDGVEGQRAEIILEGLGGPNNVLSMEHCTTRLRVSVAEPELVDESRLQAAEPLGIVRPSQNTVQVIIGPAVEFLYEEVSDALQRERTET